MGKGTKENLWQLKIPSLSSNYQMNNEVEVDQQVLVCVVGKTTLISDYCCLSDLLRVMFTVDGIDEMLTRLYKHGAKLVGEWAIAAGRS